MAPRGRGGASAFGGPRAFRADGDDLCYVQVDAVDAAGMACPLAVPW